MVCTSVGFLKKWQAKQVYVTILSYWSGPLHTRTFPPFLEEFVASAHGNNIFLL